MFILMNFINFFCFIHAIKIYLEEGVGGGMT